MLLFRRADDYLDELLLVEDDLALIGPGVADSLHFGHTNMRSLKMHEVVKCRATLMLFYRAVLMLSYCIKLSLVGLTQAGIANTTISLRFL